MASVEQENSLKNIFFINAAGGFLPSTFVFPRAIYKDIMLANGPPGALGLSNFSEWMNE